MSAARPPRTRALILGLGWFPDQHGGLDRYVRELIGGLGADAEAVVIGPASDAPEAVHAVATHDAPLVVRLSSFARAARRAADRADVIDAHFALYAALPLAVGRGRRRPLVVHFHGPWAAESVAGGDARGLGYWVRRAIERFVCRRADMIVVLSEAFRAIVVQQTGVARDRVVVIPPGVDQVTFSPGDRALARAQLEIPADAWVAVAARRLVPRTGVDVLLEAWDALGGDPQVRLLVAGDGPSRDDLEATAERYARRFGPTMRMVGAVSDDDLVALYRAADVCVVPSRSLEGFGLVVLEALACGTPVVVTDVGGLPEAVAGLGHDLVVPPDDAAALGARLVEARRGRQPLPSREACRAFATRFSWDATVERHRVLYARVAGREPRRPRVMFVDHTARLSGGEIAMLRTVDALVRAPGVTGAEVEAVLFEAGPLEARLRACGATVDRMRLGRAAGSLDRSRIRPGRVPLRAVAGASVGVLQLARRLRRRRPDLVHANSLKAGVIGGLACQLTGIPMVWHLRDRLADDYMPAAAVRLLRWLIPRLAVCVVANSRTTLTAAGLPGSFPAFVVPDPYRAHPIPPAPPSRPDSEGARGLRIGMVGRIAPWKGQDRFVDAFARAFPDGGATAVIVGAPLFGEDDYDRSLRTRVRALGIEDRVEFTGFVDEVPELLAGLDVLVHASIIPEPYGQVVVEGMAAGLPVIATGAGGPAEIITPDVDGVLVAPDDVDALTGALRRLADDRDLRTTLGAAARRRVADFDPDVVVPALQEVYARALARTTARGER